MFLLLLTAYITKKKIYPLRIIAGTFSGTLSIFMLFTKLNDFSAFFFKFVFAVIMISIAFKTTFKGYVKVTVVFYLLSFALSGIIYYFNTSFGKSDMLNYLTICLSSTCFISLLVICVNSVKQRILDKKLYKKVIITHNSKTIVLTGFLDSGNSLTEPLTGLPVIIADKNELCSLGKFQTTSIMCRTISGNSIIEVFKPDKLLIDNVEESAYIGICDKLKNDNFSILLNNNQRRLKDAS